MTLNTPVVRLGSVHVRVTAKDPGMMVSLGKRVLRGLITGGAPDLKYLQKQRQMTLLHYGHLFYTMDTKVTNTKVTFAKYLHLAGRFTGPCTQ